MKITTVLTPFFVDFFSGNAKLRPASWFKNNESIKLLGTHELYYGIDTQHLDVYVVDDFESFTTMKSFLLLKDWTFRKHNIDVEPFCKYQYSAN